MRSPKLLTTLRGYSRANFLADLISGISVAMIALPLSLAIAIASGASPAQGLITAIVGGFMVSLLGGSRVQIGGPTGAFIVVVYTVIAEYGYDGLVLATFMAGLILLVAGYFRLGKFISLVPEAVVHGFTIGIGIIIGVSQVKDFFGLPIDNLPANILEKIPALWAVKGMISWHSVLVGISTGILIVIMRRKFPKFPGLIVAIAATSAIATYLQFPVDSIASRFGSLPNGLPMPTLPDWSIERIISLLPSALIIAFLAAVESLLSAIVADNMIEGSHRPNAEVLAQGAANVASSLFGGMPVTGAIARTATNVQAGGRTPVAGLVHAVTILIILMVGAEQAGYLVMPALAALLLLTAWNMMEVHRWPEYLKLPRSELVLLIITMGLTVLTDLTLAIGVGVSLGLALRLRDRKKSSDHWSTPER
ncbi:MAG: SulP family inorganic anion transporter [Rhodobacteraceae bacterium]|nr:SulP family inorganic anion transporter [Paracoccaceae bacterium]